MRSELIFNGQPFSAFDAYVATSNFLDGAAKDYTSVSVLGRSGDLQISNNRYKNITVKVRVYVRSNMEQNIRAMRSYLESVNGYARLELSDQPNEYRIGLYKEMFAPKPYDRNVGAVELTFDCKPQRFLKSGEIPVSASSQSVSYEGNPVEIDNPSGISAVSSLAVALNPTQDLNGYDAPWVGGSGKNKCQKYTVDDFNGKPTYGMSTYITLTLPNGTYTVSTNAPTGYIWSGTAFYYDNYLRTFEGTPRTWEVTDGKLLIGVLTTDIATSVGYNLQIEEGSTPTAYEPYENICPIYASNGKNLLPPSTTQTSNGVKFTVNDDGTITATRTASSTNNAEYDLTVPSSLYGKTVILNGCPSGGNDSNTYRMFFLVNGSRQATDYGNGVTYTIPSSPTSCVVRINVFKTFNSTATFKPMIRPASITDSTYVPYQSIIVTRTGKNFLPSHAVGSTTTNGVTFTANANGTITVNGTATAEAQYAITFSNLTGNYYFSGCPSGGSNTTYEMFAWDYTASARFKKWNGTTASDSDFGTGGKEINIPSGHNGSLSIRIRSGYTANNLVFKPMIRLASETDATYEPYQGNTYTINLNGTRYGGTVDLVTGVLTVTHGFVTFDGSSDENWTLQTDGRRCAIRLTDCKIVEGIRRNIGAISNLYEEEYPIDTWNSVIGFSIEANGDLVVRQFTTNTMTVADFKTFLQSNPMQVCYPLETPQTVQLTAQQISLLTGTNYISSSGEVTVTVSEPSLLENPTLFESKPLIRVYGHGTLIVNNQYITIAENPYAYIDIDCDIMDAFYGANNANQYVTLPNDYVTLHSGSNYIAYDGMVQITPRWYEV